MSVKILSTQNKIEELESLRGLAALLVVMYHFPKWNSILDVGFINNAYLMVELFFVLSGFVIFSAYSDKIQSGKDLARFQFLRFGRLYPVHLLFLVLFLAVEIARYIASTQLKMNDLHMVPFEANGLTALVEQLLLIQAIGPTGNHLTFNTPAWSISVEFYTYLIFGVAVLFLKKLKTQVFFLFALVSLVLLATDSGYEFTDLLRCFAGFFVGCLTAATIRKVQTQIPGYVSLIIFMLLAAFLELKTPKKLDIVIYFLTAMLTASLVLSKHGLLNRFLKFNLLTWFGNISYSIYMAHTFALLMAGVVMRRVLKRPEVQLPNGMWVASLTVLETLAAAISVIALVVFVSQLTYLLVEKPMRERSRRIALDKLS